MVLNLLSSRFSPFHDIPGSKNIDVVIKKVDVLTRIVREVRDVVTVLQRHQMPWLHSAETPFFRHPIDTMEEYLQLEQDLENPDYRKKVVSTNS